MKQGSPKVTLPSDIHGSDCKRVGQLLARVGDRWSILIIMALAEQPLRFSALKRSIEGISQRMLTLCLKGMVRDGLISRTVKSVMPPHVEYALTPLGRSLTDPIMALSEWARQHINDIDTARATFDAEEANQGGPTPWQHQQ